MKRTVEKWLQRGRDAFDSDPLRSMEVAWRDESGSSRASAVAWTAWMTGYREAMDAYTADLTPKGRTEFYWRRKRAAGDHPHA